MAEEVSHTARVHGWFSDEEGREVHVTRRDDGKWYLNTNGAEDPISYVSMAEAIEALEEAYTAGRSAGFIAGGEGGEPFDEQVAPIFQTTDDEADQTPAESARDAGPAGTEDPQD